MAYEIINLEFLKELKRSDKKIVIDFCINIELFASEFECPICKLHMTLCKQNEEIDGYCWSCPAHRETSHNYYRSVRCKSWFRRRKSAVIDILICMYMWVTNTMHRRISEELQLSEGTIHTWICRCRDVCVEMVMQENVILGGPGVIVEIYEAEFVKNSSYRGRITGEWVYLVAERGTNKCFVQVKGNQDNTVLLDILYERVLPGTIIVSYGWNADDCYHFHQHKINLERNNNLTFMEGEPRPDTTECFWTLVENTVYKCKTGYKFDSMVAEFMWRHFHQGDYQALLRSFLMNISCHRWQEDW